MGRKPKPAEVTGLIDQLRRVIRERQESGESLHAISDATEGAVDAPRLSRFMSGKRGLSIEALDAIWRALHLRIVDETAAAVDEPSTEAKPAKRRGGK